MAITSFEEFKSDLGALREEIHSKAGDLDVKIIAAWADKLAIMLEDIAGSLALLEQRVDTISDKK